MLTLQKLEDDIHCLGLKIKQHEDNIKYLRQQVHRLDDSILDMQGMSLHFSFHSLNQHVWYVASICARKRVLRVLIVQFRGID